MKHSVLTLLKRHKKALTAVLADPVRRTAVLFGIGITAALVFGTVSVIRNTSVEPAESAVVTVATKADRQSDNGGITLRNDAVVENVDLFRLVRNAGATQKLYVLSTRDRALYQRIFTAQSKGDWARANALLKRLENRILVGHVLYDRYINSADYRATYPELRRWMVRYGDHPDAFKVYQLAQKRRQNDPAALPAPQVAKKLFGALEMAWLTKTTNKKSALSYKPKRHEGSVRSLMATIKRYLATDSVTAAYNLLGQSPVSKTLSALEYDALLGEIAAGYYYNAKYDTAHKVAAQAVRRSGSAAYNAAWIAGLAAWQQSNHRAAAQYFEVAARAHNRNPWILSAGAFWAARAHERLNNNARAEKWLHEAAAHSRTFYGLVAQAKLGRNASFSWNSPIFNNNLANVLSTHASGDRALALLDIGKKELAARELKQIHPEKNLIMQKALVSAANHFGLASLALHLGNAVNQPDGKLYDVALYPVAPWKGDETTGIDPALVNALIRQESKFDPTARNRRSGATGLMQLMPKTARFVSDKSFNARDMHKPEVNVALGQRYVRYLLDMSRIDGNLMYLAAAYNAGPGNLARWQNKIEFKNDPFLFMESIPLSETRTYIERVLTNYWIYNQRLDNDNTSLQQLANGEWPTYDARAAVKLASN